MEQSREFNGGRPPQSRRERIAGLEEAINATVKRVAEHKAGNADTSELETHLTSLQNRLKKELEG